MTVNVGASAISRTGQRLLRAAARLFAAEGYRAVTLEEIGGAVGISGPGVYRHFPSKQALLDVLLLEVSERLVTEATERIAHAANKADALESLIDYHIDLALDEAEIIGVQAREFRSLSASAQSRVRSCQRRYVELWADCIVATHGCDVETARAAALAVFGLLNSTPFSSRLDRTSMRSLLGAMARAALAFEQRTT